MGSTKLHNKNPGGAHTRRSTVVRNHILVRHDLGRPSAGAHSAPRKLFVILNRQVETGPATAEATSVGIRIRGWRMMFGNLEPRGAETLRYETVPLIFAKRSDRKPDHLAYRRCGTGRKTAEAHRNAECGRRDRRDQRSTHEKRTAMPIGRGYNCVALIRTEPSQAMKAPTGGPTKIATAAPESTEPAGTTSRSNGVLPDSHEPISTATMTAMIAPTWLLKSP